MRTANPKIGKRWCATFRALPANEPLKEFGADDRVTVMLSMLMFPIALVMPLTISVAVGIPRETVVPSFRSD